MVMSNADTFVASAQWLTHVGHLRPWEISDANRAVREYKLSDLRRLMAKIADQVAKILRDPLVPADVETILSLAADVSGVFSGIKAARGLAREVPKPSTAWRLLLSALDGNSYEELLSQVEASAAPPKGEVRARAAERIGLTAEIVGAYVSNNAVRQGDLPGIIAQVHTALAGDLSVPGSQAETEQRPAVPIKKSITPDYLISLEDGRKFKSLKRYLRATYNMSPEEYRVKWGLAKDYPMVAPNYAKARSDVAKSAGLGRGGLRTGGRSRTAAK